MLVFPNSKINIGLNVIKKRVDGFHDLETIFYPLDLTDMLEFIETEDQTEFSQTGLFIDSPQESNLIIKAYNLIHAKYNLPSIKIHLHKIIPMGAGLGGGSADAAYMLKSLNDYFDLKIGINDLESYAQELGSDCPFFIQNKPVFAQATGNIFTEDKLELKKYFIAIIKPDIHVSTKKAFTDILPAKPKTSLNELIKEPIKEWKNLIINDFEKTVFNLYPEIKSIKDTLYNSGAIYAQMTGSGASVFGIFVNEPELPTNFKKYFTYIEKPML